MGEKVVVEEAEPDELLLDHYFLHAPSLGHKGIETASSFRELVRIEVFVEHLAPFLLACTVHHPEGETVHAILNMHVVLVV